MGLDLKKIIIKKNSPVPLYFQLQDSIERSLTSGELKEGDCIPTENEFMEALNISRSTVRQALNELVNKGYFVREKGRGTFVTKPQIMENFFHVFGSYNDEIIARGMVPSTKVLQLKVVDGITSINERLQIDENDKLIYLERIRYADGEPIVYIETYLPYKKYPHFLEVDFTQKSLFSTFEDNGEVIEYVTREVEAVMTRGQETTFLNMENDGPIFLTCSTLYLQGDIPTEFSIARYRGDRHSLTIKINKKNYRGGVYDSK